jgi:hypothetical protein
LTGLAEFGLCPIYSVDIIRLKWLIEELDWHLHCIENLGRRTNLWDLNIVAVPLAGCNPVAISSAWTCSKLMPANSLA